MRVTKAINSLQGIGTAECEPWREKILLRHAGIAHHLAKEYLCINAAEGYEAANQWLLLTTKNLKLGHTGLSLAGNIVELEDYCKAKSRKTERQIYDTAHSAGKDSTPDIIRQVVEHAGASFPLDLGDDYTKEELLGALARVCDERWWKSQLRPIQSREMEDFLRSLGGINKSQEIYLSNFSLQRRLQQKQKNKNLLDMLEAENQEGKVYTLSELAELSPSNPKIRRSELMVRIRGFENIAESSAIEYQGVLFTMTCPSKFHAAYSHGGKNPKYDGSTVGDAQEHLNTEWKRTRAAFKRQGIHPFGMRVVEPHHDGTPHWHLLLFIPSDQVEKAIAIFKHYAFEVDGDEPGADEHRFTAVKIDPAKGSATGYIAKYIAKNIDGYGVDMDLYGKDAIESAVRIEAWASINGIRQFQQIGGASVTVWRELRRLDKALQDKALLKDLVSAADESDWEAYNELMGGVICLRKDRPVHPMMIEKSESNRYGEKVKVIKGIWFGAAAVITRLYDWIVTLKKEEEPANDSEDGIGFGVALSNAPPGACVPLEFCQ